MKVKKSKPTTKSSVASLAVVQLQNLVNGSIRTAKTGGPPKCPRPFRLLSASETEAVSYPKTKE
jgi:hypothetical protein